MSKQTFKLEKTGFNKAWVRTFKTLDSFLSSSEAQHQYEQFEDGKRKELLTKVYNECTDNGPKPTASPDAKNSKVSDQKK